MKKVKEHDQPSMRILIPKNITMGFSLSMYTVYVWALQFLTEYFSHTVTYYFLKPFYVFLHWNYLTNIHIFIVYMQPVIHFTIMPCFYCLSCTFFYNFVF